MALRVWTARDGSGLHADRRGLALLETHHSKFTSTFIDFVRSPAALNAAIESR